MAKKISEIADELKIEMTFEQKESWDALVSMSFREAKDAFRLWFGANEEAQRRLKCAGKLILINEFNGDACVKAHPNYKEPKPLDTGNCGSIW